ncbi:MAG: hypothetical protein SNJ65_14065, partial [Roseiflexus sp.]
MPASIDHDALFKRLLTAFFRDFLALVAPDLAQALVPDHLIFLDKESFTDLVVQVRLRAHPATL